LFWCGSGSGSSSKSSPDPDPDPGGGEGVGQPKMCIPPGQILGTPLACALCSSPAPPPHPFKMWQWICYHCNWPVGHTPTAHTRGSDPDPDPNWILIQSGQWIPIRKRERGERRVGGSDSEGGNGGGGGWEWKTLKTDICMEIKKDQYSRILDNGHIYSTVVFFVGSLGVNVMYYEFLFMVMNSEYCRYRQASNPIILVRSLPHNYNVWIIKQGCRSGSWFNRVSGSGSGSKRAKRPTKVELFKVPIWSFGWPIWELKATSVTLMYGYGLQLQSAGSFHRSTGHNITMINYQRSVDPDPGRQKEPTKM
jgi:hypothetical protein